VNRNVIAIIAAATNDATGTAHGAIAASSAPRIEASSARRVPNAVILLQTKSVMTARSVITIIAVNASNSVRLNNLQLQLKLRLRCKRRVRKGRTMAEPMELVVTSVVLHAVDGDAEAVAAAAVTSMAVTSKVPTNTRKEQRRLAVRNRHHPQFLPAHRPMADTHVRSQSLLSRGIGLPKVTARLQPARRRTRL